MQQANDVSVKYATRDKNPTNDDNMIYYVEPYPAEYVIVADDEHSISLSAQIPVGAKIVYVELETKPLLESQYTYNSTTCVLTIGSPAISTIDPRYVATFAGQLLKVIYKIVKTTIW